MYLLTLNWNEMCFLTSRPIMNLSYYIFCTKILYKLEDGNFKQHLQIYVSLPFSIGRKKMFFLLMAICSKKSKGKKQKSDNSASRPTWGSRQKPTRANARGSVLPPLLYTRPQTHITGTKAKVNVCLSQCCKPTCLIVCPVN